MSNHVGWTNDEIKAMCDKYLSGGYEDLADSCNQKNCEKDESHASRCEATARATYDMLVEFAHHRHMVKLEMHGASFVEFMTDMLMDDSCHASTVGKNNDMI